MCKRLSSNDPQPTSGDPGDRWIDLCGVDEIPDSGGGFATLENRGLAVFRVADRVHVVDNRCPHAGGSLSGGFVDNGCVICPWHGWPFDITTGQCPDNGQWNIRVYTAKVVNDRVHIKWPS